MKVEMDTLKLLSKPAVQKFIAENENSDPFNLSLKHKAVDEVPIHLIAQQIDQRKRAKKSSPNGIISGELFFPPKFHWSNVHLK